MNPLVLRLAKLKFKQVASPLAKLRSGAGRRLVDGLERILLDEVAVINQRLLQGVLNVAQLVDGAHRFAVSAQGLDGIEYHLVGGNFTEVNYQGTTDAAEEDLGSGFTVTTAAARGGRGTAGAYPVDFSCHFVDRIAFVKTAVPEQN